MINKISFIVEGTISEISKKEDFEGFEVSSIKISFQTWHKNNDGTSEINDSFIECYIFGNSCQNLEIGKNVRALCHIEQTECKDTNGNTHLKSYVVSEMLELKVA